MPDEVVKRVEQLGKLDGQPNLLTFTNEDGENYLDSESIADDDDISYKSEIEIQNEDHDNMEETTGVEYENSEHEDDLVYSDNDDNLSIIPEEDKEPYVSPDNLNRRPGRLSPRSW